MFKESKSESTADNLSQFEKSGTKHTINGTLFQIYKGKNFYSPCWKNKPLGKLILEARKSYLRYGPVVESDEYDKKSVIYLARALYNYEYENVLYPAEEWLSVRFVPANGLPKYTEDLKISLCDDMPLIDWLQTSDFNKTGNIAERIITISRVCGIPTRTTSGTETKNIHTTLSSKLQHTGILFALINKQFLDDCVLGLRPFRYITGIFQDKMIEKVLTVKTKKQKTIPDFVPGFVFLGLNDSGQIKLNRSAIPSPYEFPAYFLKTDQLYVSLMFLLDARRGPHHITANTLVHYIGKESDPNIYMKDFHAFEGVLPKLGNMLTANGKLYDSELTGEQLRFILDRTVKDGPQLKMMNIEAWRDSLEEYLAIRTYQ